MMFKTHLVFGLFIGLLAIQFLEISEKWLFLGIVVVSSILADIDSPFSKIGRKVRPLSWLFSFLFGHRSFIHTIWFPLIIYAILSAFEKHLWAGAFFLGYMSHLVLDMLNVKGINFFWPLRKARINGFITSGGMIEWVLFIVIIIGIILLII